ncbi:MAG: amino acid/peptide transporter [Myxococcales bacterium]|nr:amino acid/peptide transporter [Myxococcales bacterium]
MARDRDTGFFGHPIGLANLFFTEMWERFSYYGMRAFLLVYLATPTALGGKGMFDPIKNQPLPIAGAIVGMFGASVYLLALPGGWIADRFLGQRKAVIVGGIGIAIGNGILAFPGLGDMFYLGLVFIAFGTGFLKPNISTLVGQLYPEGDPRRDSGYTIYYMGINIGAFLAPLACGYLAQHPGFREWLTSHDLDPNLCWNFAFGCAAVGMVFGLIQFMSLNHWLGEAGKHPTIPDDPVRAKRDRTVLMAIVAALVVVGAVVVLATPSAEVIRETMGIGLIIGSVLLFVGLYASARDAKEKRGILAMLPLYIGAISFFAIFEQAPTTLAEFGEYFTARELFGVTIPASYYQSVNSIFIVALAPVFAFIWVVLARKGKEPNSVAKFAIGMALLALAFVVMIPAQATRESPVSGTYLIGLYFFYTLAELCISPVGLSSMSKLAPKRLAGMVMGMWFFGTAIGIYLAGRASSISAGKGFTWLFTFLFIASLVVSAILFVIAPKIRRMMANDKASAPADRTEKVEPEPLPGAKATFKKGD